MLKHTNRILSLATIVVSFALFQGSTCGPPVNQDPGFDMWCGNELCAWEVLVGQIQRVATWHRSDYGVSLESERVELTQLVRTTAEQGRCFQVEMQVEQDDGVRIHFEVDFNADGSPELNQPVTARRWEVASFPVTAAAWFDTVRFTITKAGTGRAILARLRIDRDGSCVPIDLKDRPEGAACDDHDQCRSGICRPVRQWRPDVDGSLVDVCSTCWDDDCAPGLNCDVVPSQRNWFFLGCTVSGGSDFGHRCLHAEACTRGTCCEGVCSQCCEDTDCPDAKACRPRDWRTLGDEFEFQMLPWQCAPGAGQGVAGDPCLWNDDCASGTCLSSDQLKHCFLDGRTCEMDEDCPLWNACLIVGVAGGRCL